VSVVNGNGAGGLVGGIGNSIITNAYATGDVSGVRTVGGLIGAGTATLDHVWASGDVTGSYYVGGLMGTSSSGSVITNAYATGSVTNMASAADSYTGGLIGYNTGALSDSYATGAVIGQDGTITGGLVGFNRDDVGATISDSYYNSEANSGLSGVGNSGSPNINNIVGLDNSDIDSQFGDQIQQNDQNAADNIGRNDDAAATNQDSYNEAAANEAIRSGNDNSVNDAITEAESDWQSGQSDRNAATTAPEDVWQSDVQARDNNRQAEINRIEAEAADSIARAEAQRQAELLAQRQAELQAQQLAALQAQLLRDNIATGQLASAGAKKVADDARGNLLKVAAGVSGSGEPERAGEYVTGASLNGLAQDSYKYGVEQMEVEGRSFTTGNSLQNEDQEKEDAETAAEE
jgi:hypothetical protein